MVQLSNDTVSGSVGGELTSCLRLYRNELHVGGRGSKILEMYVDTSSYIDSSEAGVHFCSQHHLREHSHSFLLSIPSIGQRGGGHKRPVLLFA